MPIPAGTHTDWHHKPDIPFLGPILGVITYPLSLIPRSWTAFESTVPPKQLFGTAPPDAHLDIPPRGTWAIASIGDTWIPGMLAIYLKRGWYLRIGIARFDYVDLYYQLPTFTIKNYGPEKSNSGLAALD